MFRNVSVTLRVGEDWPAGRGGRGRHTLSIDSNSSGDEIANVNFYAVRPEATRIR